MPKSKRSKACQIPLSVREAVYERDGGKCILCPKHVEIAFANAHYIGKAQMGLGKEQNIVTLCLKCHHEYDHTGKRKILKVKIENYLRSFYDDWDNINKVYSKWGN